MASSATAAYENAPAFGNDDQRSAQTDLATGSLRILWRRRRLIMACVLAALALVTAYILIVKPLYSAVATLQITSYETAAEDIGDASPARPQDEMRIATQLEQLQSQTLALAVVRKLDLVNDPEFNPPRILPSFRHLFGFSSRLTGVDDSDVKAVKEANVTDRLMQHYVVVARTGVTHLVTITARSADPRKAVLIANTFVGLHLKRLQDEKRAATQSTIKALEARVAELRSKATGGEQAAAAYGHARGFLGDAQAAGNPVAMDVLTTQLANARSGRAEAAARYQNYSGGGAPSAGSASSPLLNELQTQQATLDKRLTELSASYGPGYPEVVSVKAQRDDLARRIDEERDRVRRSLGADLAVAHAREAQLSSEVGSVRSSALNARETGVGFGDLQSSAQATRAQYMAQLSRLQDLKGRDGRLTIDAKLASNPVLPTVPSDPKPLRLYAVALIGGFMLGCIAAILRDQLNTRLFTGDQVERLLGAETFAMVPELSKKDLGRRPQRLIADQPTSAFAESIRTTYFELVAGTRTSRPCIVVASPLPGEGKTTIAVSLAAVAVGLGLRTVLVDLDLRRPSVSRTMGLPKPAAGVNDYLEGRAGLDEVVTADPDMPQLFTIGVSELPADPGSLINPRSIEPMIAALRKQFDIIVIDAPPILPVRDAQTLSSLADATLVVLHWGQTRQSAIRVVQRLMRGRVTGAVINRVDYRRHAAAAYGDQLQHYQSYASYFGTPQTAPETGLVATLKRWFGRFRLQVGSDPR